MTKGFSYLPCIDPDESIYSWCAFLSTSNSKKSGPTAIAEILGFEYALVQFDLPTRLDYLIDKFQDAVPELDVILRDHTIAGFFWPFISEYDRNRIRDSLMNRSTTRARQALLQSITRLNFHRYLRWCPDCLSEDLDRIGRATWKTKHLYPTYLVCTKHKTWLHVARKKFKRLVLPNDPEVLCISTPIADASSKHLEAAVLISRVSDFIQTCQSADHLLLKNAVLRKLYRLGVLLPNKCFTFENLIRWFQSSAIGALCAADVSNPFTPLADGKWIRVLFWGSIPNSAIRWAVLWCAFDWKSPSDAVYELEQALKDVHHDHAGQQLMFVSGSECIRAPDRIWQALEHAKTLYEAAAIVGMTKSWVQYWLRNDNDLAIHWQKHLVDTQVCTISEKVHLYMSQNPDVTTWELRDQFRSELAMLKKHWPERYHHFISMARSHNLKNTQIRLM